MDGRVAGADLVGGLARGDGGDGRDPLIRGETGAMALTRTEASFGLTRPCASNAEAACSCCRCSGERLGLSSP